MLLQAMADQFGLPVTAYAETAFQAELAPKFSYGCAVFLDTDRVNFQKEGFSREELLAGLAQVLPKNVWQYVVQIPRLASLGKKYVLQGGTQYNLAAVKAQVDYIKERVPDAEVLRAPALRRGRRDRRGLRDPAGGQAPRALELHRPRRGDRARGHHQDDESTTCHFCPNECKRTFIDTKRPDGEIARYIAGFSCEKGTVESEEMKKLVEPTGRRSARRTRTSSRTRRGAPLPTSRPSRRCPRRVRPRMTSWSKRGFLGLRRKEVAAAFCAPAPRCGASSKKTRIGMPRVLNMYSTAPYFRAYFEALGMPKQNVVFSEETSEELWVEGGKYGSIDPCFPSKVVQAHVHNLLFQARAGEEPTAQLHLLPILTHVKSSS
jgi:hypothetical protein